MYQCFKKYERKCLCAVFIFTWGLVLVNIAFWPQNMMRAEAKSLDIEENLKPALKPHLETQQDHEQKIDKGEKDKPAKGQKPKPDQGKHKKKSPYKKREPQN